MKKDKNSHTYYTPEYRNIDKQVKRSIRKDIRNLYFRKVQEALEINKSLKIATQGMEQGKSTIICVKDQNGKKNDRRHEENF